MTPTPDSEAALAILRMWPEDFKWYLIPLFAIVIYLYAVEIEKQNWSRVFAGLAFWGMDWFNEIWNALVKSIYFISLNEQVQPLKFPSHLKPL